MLKKTRIDGCGVWLSQRFGPCCIQFVSRAESNLIGLDLGSSRDECSTMEDGLVLAKYQDYDDIGHDHNTVGG